MSEELLAALARRVAELEADAADMPAYANPRRYYRVTSNGASADGFGPAQACPSCGGVGHVPERGEYETVYEVAGRLVVACGLCGGTGLFKKRLSRDELAALGSGIEKATR